MARGVSIARWLRHSPTGRGIASWVAAKYIRFVNWSSRWDIQGREAADRFLEAEDRGVIAAIWHGRLFLSATYATVHDRKMIAMISNNSDGELISDIVADWNITSVRGSSYDREKKRNKGGARVYGIAKRALLEDKAVIAITPDGPRGPRMRAQAGTTQLAIDTQCCVIPVAFSVKRGKVLRSWDRFLVPSPFNRGTIIYGEAMRPPSDPTPEEARAFHFAVEAALTDVTNRADDLCGRARIQPGAPIEVL